MTHIKEVLAAKSFSVFRAVKDIYPENINDHFHGKGIFGDGTYYALEEKTAFRYATGAIMSPLKKFAIVIAYKMTAQNPLVLTPKLVEGLEPHSEWITFKEDEDAEDLGMHSSFERDKLAELAGDNDFDAIVLKGPGKTVDGENQVLVPVGSQVKLTALSFTVMVGSSMADLTFAQELHKKLGGEAWSDHYNGVTKVPIAKLKDLSTLLKTKYGKG